MKIRSIIHKKKSYMISQKKISVAKIRFRSENLLISSEMWAIYLLIMNHFSLFRREVLLLEQFSLLIFF